METPICVADARTLVDHIHDIKRWVYNGQLRLVVPTSTYEHVEQIYNKSKEIKPMPKEVPRPKSSGKPAKKEYPIFDINPLLAKNFLSRLKNWSEENPASEQRKFLEEKENHGAVKFQMSNEQYSPWKDLEVEQEEPQVVEDRPTTWAEALRRKQNLANGTVGISQVQKGPAKPKLVSKMFGSETSPWKIKKDAPKISAKDVPASLRPLLSCVLWRLHESVDRNDANELFLLCDQSEIRTVAQKLNITVRSTKDLGELVVAKAKRVDLDSFGDLEREFDVQSKAAKPITTSPKLQNGGSQGRDQATYGGIQRDEQSKAPKLDSGEAKTENSSTIRQNGVMEKLQEATFDNERERNVNLQSTVVEPVTSSIRAASMDNSLINEASNAEPDPQGSPELRGSASNIDLLTFSKEADYTTSSKADISSILLRQKIPEATAKEVPPRTDDAKNSIKEDQSAPVYPSSVQGSPKAHVDHMSTPSVQAVQEPEDSDEEVVVFVPQPKRFSNQRKPAQQNSRPSTPITQPVKQVPNQSPGRSPVLAQVHPKPPSRGRASLAPGHGHPQPTSSPTVIDPDAFGRSFAVNPNPSPRSQHNPRSHHRPKSSIESAHLFQGPRSSGQPDARPEFARPTSRNKSPRLSPDRKPQMNGDKDTRIHHAERTSPQTRPESLEAKGVAPRGRGSNHSNPGVPAQPKTLTARMVDSEEFVPRTAIKDSQFGPVGTPPKATASKTVTAQAVELPIQVKSDEHEARTTELAKSPGPRNPMPILENKSRSLGPQLSKANDFVPRSAMPTMQYRQRTPEPDAIEPRASMPDVQYVLKSGSTRAATRGRGRLWTPS